MRFITVRDLRSRPAQVWRALSKEKEIILTLNGQPIAILHATSGDTLEESLSMIRRARAMAAVSNLQARSAEQGTNRISLAEINKEIANERKGRKSR